MVGLARAAFAASTLATILLTLLIQLNIQLISNLISALNGARSVSGSLTVWFAIVSLLVVVLTVGSRLLATWSDALLLARLQQRLHDGLLAPNAVSARRLDVQAANSVVLDVAALVQPVLRDVVAVPLTRGVALVSAIAYLLYNLDSIREVPAGLGIVLVALLVGLSAATWAIRDWLREAYGAVGRSLADLAVELGNSTAAPAEIVLLGAQPQRSRAFGRRLGQAVAAKLAAGLRMDLARQLQLAMPVLVQTGFLVYGATMVVGSQGTPIGSIIALYSFAPMVMLPLQQVLDAWLQVSVRWGAVVMVGDMLDSSVLAPDDVPEVAGNALSAPEIVLQSVFLAYKDDGAAVLRGLGHVFPAGSCTAVVGRAGSGKSTLLMLIAGLVPPNSGAVLMAGRAVQSLSPALFGIGLVSDTPLLIVGTVRENFRLARVDADDADIEAACRETGLWELLLGLAPDGPLDYVLSGDARHGLTGGGRRLLAIARALLRRPSVLLLDEPTSGLDAVGAEQLADCLRRLTGKTTIVLADQNLDFVARLADTVCCLEDGIFDAVGTPTELASRPSLFQRLLRSRRALLTADLMSITSVKLPSLRGAAT
jgi:ATP-binding cassette subfamily B protein